MNDLYTIEDQKERLFGRKIRNHLNSDQPHTSHQVNEHLFLARQKALAHQSQSLATLSLAGAGHYLMGWGRDAWRPVAMALLLAVLAVGYDHWQAVHRAAELEEVDSALLSGDLPINAYLDHGFDSWLRNSSDQP